MPASGVLLLISKADRSDAVLAGAGVATAGGVTAIAAQGKRKQRLSEVARATDAHTMARRSLDTHGPQAQHAKDYAQKQYDEMMNIRTPKGYKPRGQTFMNDAARVLADRDIADRNLRNLHRNVEEKAQGVTQAKGRVKAPTRLRNVGLLVAGVGAGVAAGSAAAVERKRRQPKAEPAPKVPLRNYRALTHDGIPANVSPSAGRDWLKANEGRS